MKAVPVTESCKNPEILEFPVWNIVGKWLQFLEDRIYRASFFMRRSPFPRRILFKNAATLLKSALFAEHRGLEADISS